MGSSFCKPSFNDGSSPTTSPGSSFSSSSTTTASSPPLEAKEETRQIPVDVLLKNILPCVSDDRTTLNKVSLASKEIHQSMATSFPYPWPNNVSLEVWNGYIFQHQMQKITSNCQTGTSLCVATKIDTGDCRFAPYIGNLSNCTELVKCLKEWYYLVFTLWRFVTIIRIWNAASGHLRDIRINHWWKFKRSEVHGMAFSPTHPHIMVAGKCSHVYTRSGAIYRENVLYVFDVKREGDPLVQTIKYHASAHIRFEFTSDGSLVQLDGKDLVLSSWNESEQTMDTLLRWEHGHGNHFFGRFSAIGSDNDDNTSSTIYVALAECIFGPENGDPYIIKVYVWTITVSKNAPAELSPCTELEIGAGYIDGIGTFHLFYSTTLSSLCFSSLMKEEIRTYQIDPTTRSHKFLNTGRISNSNPRHEISRVTYSKDNRKVAFIVSSGNEGYDVFVHEVSTAERLFYQLIEETAYGYGVESLEFSDKEGRTLLVALSACIKGPRIQEEYDEMKVKLVSINVA